MSELSFNTVLTTLFTSNLLFSLSCIFFSNPKLTITVGHKTIFFILFLSVIRLLIPIDFKFTTNVLLEGIPSKISIFIRTTHMTSNGIHFSIWNLLLIIWGCGTLFYIFNYFYRYKKLCTIIFTTGKNVTFQKKYALALEEVKLSYGIYQHFFIYELPFISSPMLFSIRKPCILLPQNNNYCKDDLIFIFRHELTHFKHHDLCYKLFFQIVTAIYWWNPLKYLLQKQLNNLLEVNVDASVTQNSKDLIPYMECLLKIVKQSIPGKEKNFLNCTLSMSNLKKDILEKRFLLLAQPRKKRFLLPIFISIVSISIFLVSYCFTLEPSALPKSTDTEYIFTLTEENSYAIKNSNGTYDIYLYGEYLETVDSLKYYSSLPVKNR